MNIHDQMIASSLCYVVPQINNTPSAQGFSATQWAMGAQPRILGVLMGHDPTTAQLTPSEAMEQKLHHQKQAAIAVIEADNNARLRRALLRQHQDAPGGASPKLRWKGPAVVAMTNTY